MRRASSEGLHDAVARNGYERCRHVIHVAAQRNRALPGVVAHIADFITSYSQNARP
jgi:hypothetical protein